MVSSGRKTPQRRSRTRSVEVASCRAQNSIVWWRRLTTSQSSSWSLRRDLFAAEEHKKTSSRRYDCDRCILGSSAISCSYYPFPFGLVPPSVDPTSLASTNIVSESNLAGSRRLLNKKSIEESRIRQVRGFCRSPFVVLVVCLTVQANRRGCLQLIETLKFQDLEGSDYASSAS